MTQAQLYHRNKMPARQGGGAERPRARVCARAWHHDVDVVLLAAARGPSRTFGASAPPPAARALGVGASRAGCGAPRQRSGDWARQRGSRAGLGPGFARHVGSSTRDRKNAAAGTPRSHQIAQLPGLLALVRDVFVQAESQGPLLTRCVRRGAPPTRSRHRRRSPYGTQRRGSRRFSPRRLAQGRSPIRWRAARCGSPLRRLLVSTRHAPQERRLTTTHRPATRPRSPPPHQMGRCRSSMSGSCRSPCRQAAGDCLVDIEVHCSRRRGDEGGDRNELARFPLRFGSIAVHRQSKSVVTNTKSPTELSVGSVKSWSVDSCRCASSTSARSCACTSAVDRSASVRVCWCVKSHTIMVNPSTSARYRGADLDLRGERRPISAQLPAGVTCRGWCFVVEQPRKICFAKIVEHGRRAPAYHLAAFDTIQACRPGAPIADVPRLVEENQNRLFRRLIETAQRTVDSARLTLG